MNINLLKNKASYVRIRALEDAVRGGKGHLGGSFSCVELLVYIYYSQFLNITPNTIKDINRDFFLMGKGHACLSLYPILYDLGFISKSRYLEYGKNGSTLGGQLDTTIPGVEYNTGSLGHVLGICSGIAKASQIDGRNNKAIALVGDAECDEGSIWEAIFFAAENKLKNLVCIVDRNKLSVTKKIDSEIVFGNFVQKMSLFEWNCYSIDGHNFNEISNALSTVNTSTKPTMILANTIKGKGVSFMENDVKWHHTMPSKKEIKIAREELGVLEDTI